MDKENNHCHNIDYPLVSFVTTVFNGEPYLETCVRWLQKVDWPVIEIVIVNDGSTDKTGDIAMRLAADDARIKVYDFGRLGRSSALNRAISLANGNIIAIQDVDDYCLPQRLKATVPFLIKDPSVAFVAGRAARVTSREGIDQLAATLESTAKSGIREIYPRDLYMGKNPIVHPSIVFRKETAESFHGYIDGTCIEDLEFYFSLFTKGRCIIVQDIVTIVYMNPKSAMKSLHNSFQYLSDLIKAQKRARKILKISRSDRIYDLVPFYLFIKAIFLRLDAYIISLKRSPLIIWR